MDEETRREAEEVLPMFEELVEGGRKVHLLQSLVAGMVVREVFEGVYAGMGAGMGEKVREMEMLLREFGEFFLLLFLSYSSFLLSLGVVNKAGRPLCAMAG